MLFANGEKTSYITLIALVASVSSTTSIVQQVYYACHWRNIKTIALQQAKESLNTPSIAFRPLFTGFNLALYEIQYCCYVTLSVLVLFWCVVLAKGMFGLRFAGLRGKEVYVDWGAKLFAMVVPGVLIGITFTDTIKNNVVADVTITNALVIVSSAISSVIILAVLVRYVYSRHLFTSISEGTSTADSRSPATPKIRVDKALLLRFMLAFVILSVFQATLIGFRFLGRSNARTLARQQRPDYSVGGAVDDIMLFIPGVTASIMDFAVFGTTAQFRKMYADAFRSRKAWVARPSSLEAWDPLASGRQFDTYRCTIRSGNVESVELGTPASPFTHVKI
ncbi:hypothetical protein LTR08_002070 [Meristemomyces frigidus]|nr:hypothetical protein LTR08_002070 [Meristemomyces frigidus]